MDQTHRNRVLTVLFIGVLMGALDIAIVGPALPAIQNQFSLQERSLSWIFSVYVLFNLVGTPLMAKLSDLFGRRIIYILDVTLFAAGSLIVAVSPVFWVVLLGRGIQGFGAGGIFPVASAVIGDTFPVEKRGSALGLIGAVFGIAFILGPILGGIILAVASWQWLFFINLPIAAAVIVIVPRIMGGNESPPVENPVSPENGSSTSAVTEDPDSNLLAESTLPAIREMRWLMPESETLVSGEADFFMAWWAALPPASGKRVYRVELTDLNSGQVLMNRKTREDRLAIPIQNKGAHRFRVEALDATGQVEKYLEKQFDVQ